MSDFEGTPTRTATSDANTGIVDQPTKRHATRQIHADNSYSSGIDHDLVQNVGVNMSNVLQSRLEEQNTNIRERQANEAAMRQGEGKAINQIDAEKKRSGWTKGIFGESASYRGAQQRAVQNSINDEYLTQATEIDKHSATSPEEYQKLLNDRLDTLLEPYGNDKETRMLVSSTWHVASAKLANKQYESNYAYAMLQERQEYDKQVAKTFDTWTVEASLTTDPEDKAFLVQQSQMFFKGATKPANMSDIAWKESVNTNLYNSLRKGNIGAYNAAKAAGWTENLNEVERRKMDEAISAYDTDFSQKAQLVYEDAELAAMDATSLDQAATIYSEARSRLEDLETRLSGTDRGLLSLARAKQQAQQGKLSTEEAMAKADAQARKIAMQAAEAALKAQDEAKRFDALKESTRIEDPIERAGTVSELDPKISELEDALDDTILDDITRITGAEEKVSMTEGTQALFTNPKLANVVAKRVNTQEVKSPLVKTAVGSFIAGYTGMATETGVLSDKGKTVLQSISQFEKNPKVFRDTVGKVAYDNLQIIKMGATRGKTVEMIQKEVANFNDNAGKADEQGRDWGLGKNESKAQKIGSLVQSWTGQTPRGDTLTGYMEDFGRALQIYGGDTTLAQKYLKDSVQSNALMYRGIKVDDGYGLNKVVPDYNFQTLLDGAQKHRTGGASLLTGTLAALTGATTDSAGKPITNISQIEGVRIYTDSAYDGFFIDSFDAQQPVYVDEGTMKEWGNELTRRRNWQELREDKERGTVLSKWGKQEMTAPLSNLN